MRRVEAGQRWKDVRWYADYFGNVTSKPPVTGLRMFLPNSHIIAKVDPKYAPVIAAAPQMSEALDEALQFVDCNCGEVCAGTCTHSKMTAALKLARGGE